MLGWLLFLNDHLGIISFKFKLYIYNDNRSDLSGVWQFFNFKCFLQGHHPPMVSSKASVSLSLWEGYHRAGEMELQGCSVGLSTWGCYSTEDREGASLLRGQGVTGKRPLPSLIFPTIWDLGTSGGERQESQNLRYCSACKSWETWDTNSMAAGPVTIGIEQACPTCGGLWAACGQQIFLWPSQYVRKH